MEQAPLVAEPLVAVVEPAVEEPAVEEPAVEPAVETSEQAPFVAEPKVVDAVAALDALEASVVEPSLNIEEITTLRPFVADPKTLFQPISKSQLDPIYKLDDIQII